jgi:tetratricopeptide (TPR) repeat protein
VTQFLTDTLSAANPEASGKDVTVRSIIDQAAREIDHRFKERPLIEARVRKSMGLTYLSLGAFDAAEHQLQQAESLWNELPGENTPEALDLQVSRGSIHYYRGEYQQALAVTDDAIERLRISGGSELQLIQARTARAVILMRLGRLDEAKSDLEKSTRYSNHSSGQNARVDAMGILARLYSQLGSDEAESLYQELISDSRRYYGDEHPKTLMLQGNLSAHYRTRGRSDEAIPIVRRVLEAQTRLLGATHRQTLISANNLARALAAVNQTDEALMMVNDAMEKSVAEHGELADTTLFLTTSLGIVLRRSGKLDEAESVLKQSIDLHLSQVGPDAEGTFDAQRMLINLYIARKGVQAIELATPLMTRLVTLYPDEHPRLSKLRYDIARAYISDRRYRDAERMLLLAHKSIDPHWKGAVRKLLARLYDHLGSTDEAVKWRTAQEDTKD